MPIYAEDIPDVLAGTLANLDEGFWQQIAQTYTEYMGMSWLKSKRKTFSSGYEIRGNQVFSKSSPARMSGFTDPVGNNIPDLLSTVAVPWKHADTYFSTVYQTDILMNSGKREIVNLVKVRTADALLAMAELLEGEIFGTAPNVAEEEKLYGLKYWIVQNATQGFNGGLPGDHTTIGGVNITTYPKFKNYTGTYAAITDRDFMPLVRTVSRAVNFKSPVPSEGMRKFGKKCLVLTNETGINGVETLADKRNDNPGAQLTPYADEVMIGQNAVKYIPYLDGDTGNPFYFVNQDTMYPVVLEGDFMRKTIQKNYSDQVNVTRTVWQLTCNMICIDRRRNAVIHAA
jgi:hypothetical protein